MNPTFQMRTIIKLIAWQGEFRITMLHWQTYSIISSFSSVSSCSEQPCLLGSLFNFAHWHTTLCSLLKSCLCYCWVMTTQTLPREQTRLKKKKNSTKSTVFTFLMTLQLSTFLLSLSKSLLACEQWSYCVWMTKLIIVIRTSKWTKKTAQ